MTELLLLLVAALLVLACGAFVAAEFALVTVDRPTVERAAASGDRAAAGVQKALTSLSTQLSGAQLGITITNLAIGFLAEPAIARLIDGPLGSAGVPDDALKGVSVAIAIALATMATMVAGELIPKNLAIALPLATARRVVGFQRAFTAANALPLRLLNGWANSILRRIGVEPQEELASARSAEELASLVRRSAEQGALEPETAQLLQRSIAFGDRRALDVMTPRIRVEEIAPEASAAEVLRRSRTSGRSRFPVTRPRSEEVLGIVHIKQALAVPYERRERVRVDEIMSRPLVVPDTLELDPLLSTLREGAMQIAVLVDEFGAFVGVVTLEDLIEEIVGEVTDEHDAREEPAHLEPDGSWSLQGLLRPDEASEVIGVELPEGEDYETLGGLVALLLERVPDVGDVVVLLLPDEERPRHEVTLEVVGMDGLRVDELRATVRPIEHEDEEEHR
jgi:CBS domain containing-hemolysin-like protein